MLAGVRHVAAVIAVGGNIMQQCRQRAVTCAVGVHYLFRSAHIRCDVRIHAQRIGTVFMAHGAAEFVLIEFGNRSRQQRMLGFTFDFFFRKARHIQTCRTRSAQHQIHPIQRFVGRQQRIVLAGQRFSLFFIHRQNRYMLFEECLPPLRVIGNDEFGAQRQYHRHIVFFSVFNRLHGRFRHRLARLAAHQIGRQHQRGRSGNHRLRDAIRP